MMAVLATFLDGIKEGNFNKEFFEAGLTFIQGTLSDGLPADIFDSFVDIILSRKIKAGYSTKLVGCLIPEARIDNSTVDRILIWIFSHHRKEPISLVNALLRWLIAVVEYGIVDKKNVDSYYEMIWGVLNNEKLERVTCHLLYLLTRPEDVYRGRVKTVLQMHECNGKATHTMALLSLFKSYKPEYIPESVCMRNLQGSFKALTPTVENYLKQAQDRLHQPNSASARSNFECVWSRPFVKQKIIPDAAYVHLGSNLYSEKKKRVLQCLDKKTLLNSQHSLDMPSKVLTLLLNEGGIHLLATHNQDVHVRFSYIVYYTLHMVFIERNVKLPQRECQYFLKQIIVLEDYMQQGIPVVSRFLSEYIRTWDGVEHRESIYRLMERMTFKSYEDLQALLLDYLNTLFITGTIEERCLIIRTLKTLVSNTFNHKRNESSERSPLTFLGLNPLDAADSGAVLPKLAHFVSGMCRRGLQMTNSHPLLLYACIDFYQVLAEIEDPHKSWSIIPRACVYRCLLGPSTSMLSQTCNLLLKYCQIYSTVKNTGQRNLYKAELSILEEYSSDMYNCLVRDVALSKSYRGYIFANLPNNMLCKGDATFSITDSVTMRSLLHCFGEDADSVQNVLAAFKSAFKGLCGYLDFLSKKAEI